ncbi:MAG: hypothetical protein HY843_09205 [Bdellovibrio sp.]|nr:hypothetical protein [Bdellovibrio sp.]
MGLGYIFSILVHISINCSFRFDINYHGDADTIASQKWLSGNNLFFYKTFAKAVLSWKLGPLSGLGPGVGLNPLWFIEQAKQLFSKKAKIDPLQKYRDDPEW